ncbi:C1 family peptidase [Pseudomonas sp. SBB6]|uniref:C1 family peptidase n=1 Tax=Pseudomonas sp. SBB6 TaxID=2962032 RepID=UPI0020B6BC7D|nr:C1 family peptidase [Pseudomonas sp. SBB6]MCP3752925.1 C1 family peptidase [Pseudomonas sp. SBB6]
MATSKSKAATNTAKTKPTPKANATTFEPAPKQPTPPTRLTPIAGRLFDARPDRLDFRDLPYTPPLRSLPPCWPLQTNLTGAIKSYVAQGLVLDQGSEGACTGFGLASVINYLLWLQYLTLGNNSGRFEPASPRMLYELARRYDEWPGDNYEGSSCRGALKGWHKHGVCGETLWPFSTTEFVRPLPGWDTDAPRRPLGVYYRIDRNSVVDLQAAILNIGAVYVSASAHDGWDTLMRTRATAAPKSHQHLPVIPPPQQPGSLGGHAFALVGYDHRGFVVQNSWGTRWGCSGFAVLPYEDWVVHGTDAWACALGVPQALTTPETGKAGAPAMREQVTSAFRVGSGRSLISLDRSARAPANPAHDPWPFDHPFNEPLYQPVSTQRAYELTLVTGNDGEIVPTDFTRGPLDRAGLVREIVHERPLDWLRTQPQQKTLRLALYAHGGLNSEDESIQRIRVLAPCFLANGVYPVFMTWRTGPGETIANMAEDWLRKLFGMQADRATGLGDVFKESKDRAIEALAHVLGIGVWSQMRNNARDSTQPGHGLDLVARELLALSGALQAQGAKLELHFVGHSAGAVLLGHLLDALGRNPAQRLKVQSCELFAAACSSGFANEHYLNAHARGVLGLDQVWLDVLSDENEKADGLPTPGFPAYGKSLLYLVSRALEDVRKQPLLGLARAQDRHYANDKDQWDAGALQAVQKWQANWPAKPDRLRIWKSPWVRTTRDGQQIPSTHGSFDNNIEVMTFVLTRITGKKLIGELEWLDY